jgi:hypothetical protein
MEAQDLLIFGVRNTYPWVGLMEAMEVEEDM